jgi:putative hydrolase of the HAD superfamily
MILIFDLDDTLYPELSYVLSGFTAVAESLSQRFGWSVESNMQLMQATLANEGRGAVFDRLLEHHGVGGKALVRSCVDIYRHHVPSLQLYPESAELLPQLRQPLYVVTDGHKLVQQRKVEALRIDRWIKKSYITHRYGIARAKPNIHCFQLIRERERCQWSDLVYVGDNPAKDFVNLNPLGARTVRVLTGGHKDVVARPGYDAQHTISDLSHLQSVLSGSDHVNRIVSHR